MAEQTTATKFPILAKAMGEEVAEAQPAAAEASAPPAGNEGSQDPNPAPSQAAEPAKQSFKLSDLDEEAQLQVINKTLGTNYKSLEEARPKPAKTPEQIEAEKAERKAKSLEWAIGNKKVKKEDYDRSVIVGAKTNEELAREIFSREAREIDPKYTDEEINTLFSQHYMLDADESDPVRKLRAKEMGKIAEGYRKSVNAAVEGIESDYDAFESDLSRQTAFGKQVDSVFKTLPENIDFSFEYTHANGKKENITISFQPTEDDLKPIKREIRSMGTYKALGADKKDLKDSEIMDALMYHYRAANFDKIIKKVAADSMDKATLDTMAYLKGFKGASPTSATAGTSAASDAPKKPIEHTLMRKAMGVK